MISQKPNFPELFKGIALFTPGGDLFYCLDPSKQGRWHLHLCAALQEWLGLSEPPHFLVPCYTATIDKWLDPDSHQVRIAAEAYAPVLQYQPLLNTLFETEDLPWQIAPWPEELCHPMVINTYRKQFPELWENHDLLVRLDRKADSQESLTELDMQEALPASLSAMEPTTKGYVLRLFVSGHSVATERTLQALHQLLEESLGKPYTLKVVDVYKHPEQAEANHISATPTLIKIWPLPVRRIVGELEDIDKIVRALGVS